MPSPNTSALPRSSMAAAAASGGAGAARGEEEWLRAYGRLVAMLPRVEALAAGRAHMEAVNALQHEFWEARDALVQQHLLQVDESRRMLQAAYIDLQSSGSGGPRKLNELLKSDSVDLKTFVHVFTAENTELQIQLKEIDAGAEHSQNAADHEHITEDLKAELRKLKQGYEALCSEKDKEISALVEKKDLLRDQFRTLERDYADLLSNMKKEATQATEARQELQQNVEKLQVASKMKDDEIKRLRARAKAAERKRKLAPGKDQHETCKDQQPETSQKHKKDICEAHGKGCSEDPALRVETKNYSSMQMLAKLAQLGTSQKRKCDVFLSDGEELMSDYNYVHVSGAAPQKGFCGTAKGSGIIAQDDAEAENFEPMVTYKDAEEMLENAHCSHGANPGIVEHETSIQRESSNNCPPANPDSEPVTSQDLRLEIDGKSICALHSCIENPKNFRAKLRITKGSMFLLH